MTGGGARVAQVRLAAHSDFEDQVERTEGVVVTYEVAGGLFADSATLLTAALMIDTTALFRCIQSGSDPGYAFAVLSGMITGLAVCASPWPSIKRSDQRDGSRSYPVARPPKSAIRAIKLSRQWRPRACGDPAGQEAARTGRMPV
jgi:hypothetical protein